MTMAECDNSTAKVSHCRANNQKNMMKAIILFQTSLILRLTESKNHILTSVYVGSIKLSTDKCSYLVTASVIA